MKKLLVKKFPLYLFLIACGLFALIIYHLRSTAPQAKVEIQQAIAPALEASKQFRQVRLQEYTLIKPLLMTQILSESEELMGLKQSLDAGINQLKLNGTIIDASVYVRRLNNGTWTCVNSNAQYAPGSVIKIAALITFLKMSELNPGLLTRDFIAPENINKVPKQTFNNDPMVAGKKYAAKELLTRMIVNSDNQATLIINESMDIRLFKKLFTDIGIAEPDVHDPNFKIDVTDLSKFLNILYNATYLNKSNSEYALSMLSQSTFTKGIVNGLPEDVTVAHKFGETGNKTEAQLHETAIVYVGNDPYLITIMTKGKNVQLLPGALSGLSKITYLKMKG